MVGICMYCPNDDHQHHVHRIECYPDFRPTRSNHRWFNSQLLLLSIQCVAGKHGTFPDSIPKSSEWTLKMPKSSLVSWVLNKNWSTQILKAMFLFLYYMYFVCALVPGNNCKLGKLEIRLTFIKVVRGHSLLPLTFCPSQDFYLLWTGFSNGPPLRFFPLVTKIFKRTTSGIFLPLAKSF